MGKGGNAWKTLALHKFKPYGIALPLSGGGNLELSVLATSDYFNSGGWYDVSPLSIGTVVCEFDLTDMVDSSFTFTNGEVLHLWTDYVDDLTFRGSFGGRNSSSTSSVSFRKTRLHYDKATLISLPNGRIVPILHTISTGKWGYSTNTFISGFTLSALDSVSNSSRLSVSIPAGVQTPDLADEKDISVGITGVGDGTATTIEELLQKILEQLQANTLAPTLDVAGTETGGNTGTDEDAKPYLPYIPQIFEKIKDLPGTLSNIWETVKGIPAAIAEKIGAFFTTLWGWLQNIIDAITALPAAIAEKIGALFKPDEALLTEITDAFKGKFGFFSTLKQFGSDLFGMTPETEPPVIWVHLENAESKYGYNYGDKQKIFDMTWYQKYKASVDGLLSGFLWLGYLWLLFKRAPSILNGMQMDEDLRPPLLVGDVSSAPRLGAGDPSIHYGEGFTFRSKGGRRK